MVKDISELDLDKTYTYADYLTWQFQERLELIKGKIFKMSPAPSRKHQKISIRLTKDILLFLDKGPCELYVAPFDVRLSPPKNNKDDNKIYSVVQPDLCVICDLEKLDDRGCLGAPDWIIEILSPGNNKKELDQKFSLYEENGVREYWIVHPAEETVTVFELSTEGQYIFRKMYPTGTKVPVGIFPGFAIDLNEIFTT